MLSAPRPVWVSVWVRENRRASYQTKKREKSPEILRFQDFSGCGGRTRTYGLRVMRQSQAQIGVISAPIYAIYRRLLGGFSIVSVQPCLLFSDSGSKLGQTRCARTHAVHGLYGLLSCLQRARWWR